MTVHFPVHSLLWLLFILIYVVTRKHINVVNWSVWCIYQRLIRASHSFKREKIKVATKSSILVYFIFILKSNFPDNVNIQQQLQHVFSSNKFIYTHQFSCTIYYTMHRFELLEQKIVLPLNSQHFISYL